MKKIVILLTLMLTLTQVSFAAETSIVEIERAGALKNFGIDQNDNLVLFLENGIISTNDDCASFKTISKIKLNGKYKLFKNRIINFYFNKVQSYTFSTGSWSEFVQLPKNIEVNDIEEINDNEYKLICRENDFKDVILYKYQVSQNNLIELFNTHGLINFKQVNSISVKNFAFTENDFFLVSDTNIYKMNFESKKLEILYHNPYGKIKQGYLKEANFIFFMESRISYTYLNRIDLKNNVVKELDKFSLISDEYYLSDIGEFFKYKMGLTYFYDYKNNKKFKEPNLDIVYNVIKNSKGIYYSLTNIYTNKREIYKFDTNFNEIKSNMYYDYNQKVDKNEILINNIQNNELLIYSDVDRVLRTKDDRFLYDDITEKLLLNSKVKRIINDLNNSNYLFCQNGDVKISEDDGNSWSNIKLWTDEKQINNVELDSNGNFLILTDKGLYYYDPVLKQLSQDENFKDLFISALSIYQDFYIIISENGVYRYSMKNKKVELISKIDYFDHKLVVSIVYKGEDIFYVFTKNSGIFKFNNKTAKFIPFNYGINNNLIKCAGIYKDSLLITDSEFNIYVNKIGSLNWEKLNNGKNLFITQNNRFFISTYLEINDTISFENYLSSYFIQTDENVEKHIDRIGSALFKLSKDKSRIILMEYGGKLIQMDAQSGEIIETISLKFFESIFDGISGATLSSNDSILVYGFNNEEKYNLFNVYYYDLHNHQFLDSFIINNDYGLRQTYFQFMSGDSTLIVSKDFPNQLGKDNFILGQTDLYRYKNFEFVKTINNRFIENFSTDLDNTCFIGSNSFGFMLGNKFYYARITEMINKNFESNTLFYYMPATMGYLFKDGGYAMSNDGKYAIYQNDTNYLPLIYVNNSDFSIEKTVEIDNFDKIPLIAQSNDGKYLYLANSNTLKIIDANNYKTLEIINYNKNIDSYRKRIKLLEDSDNNILFIFANDGSIYRFNGLKPGRIAIADFEFTPVNPKTGDSVSFVNHSSGNPFNYKWMVDNLEVSTEKNFKYVFETDGLKTVTLIANKGEVSDTITKSFNVSVKTGINDAYAINELTISPNPAADYIDIIFNNGASPIASEKLQIFDMLGIEILSVGTGLDLSTQRIDVSHLYAGVYFVKIGDRVLKFIKI